MIMHVYVNLLKGYICDLNCYLKMRFISIIILTILLAVAAKAQKGNQARKKYHHEASIGFGFNSFLASIGDDDKFGTRFLLQRSTVNASYRCFFTKHWAARGSFSHAYSRKNDKTNVDPARINSRLDYEMTLSEFGGMIEYHIFDETHAELRRARVGISKGPKLGVSLFVGAAVDYMRPYAELFGSKMVLKQYSPNAGFVSPKDYKKINFHFPVGAQVRLVVAEDWRIGFEAGYRLGVRDYIGNVSTVYYVDENPQAQNSDFTDTKFTGEYVTLDKEKAPIGSLASQGGRKNYFFGLMTLAYRIKS